MSLAITRHTRLDHCDGCDAQKGDVLALFATTGGDVGLNLCGGCRIKTEAMLRGARKGGPRIAPQPNTPNREDR